MEEEGDWGCLRIMGMGGRGYFDCRGVLELVGDACYCFTDVVDYCLCHLLDCSVCIEVKDAEE